MYRKTAICISVLWITLQRVIHDEYPQGDFEAEQCISIHANTFLGLVQGCTTILCKWLHTNVLTNCTYAETFVVNAYLFKYFKYAKE